ESYTLSLHDALPISAHAAAVERERHAVDVALVRERDDDVLLGDEVLDRELRITLHDPGAARVAVALDELVELGDEHRELALATRSEEHTSELQSREK